MIKEFFRKLTIFFSIYLITIAPVLAEINNNALPTNPKISSGSATIKQTTNSLTINQTTDKLITNWSSFNIGKDASVEFVQPSSTSAALNRVNASDPSYIYGSLKANGKIILINPSGVLFQGGSKVDVGAIIASSLNLKDGDFLNNKYIFEKDGLAGTVNNSGTINAFKGGAVALLSDQVTNNGTINTPDGTTALLSGEKITLTLNGNRLIKYTIDRGALNALVENKQAIDAGDGIIILSAKGLTDVFQSVVKNTGTLTAESISKQGGKIYLSAREGEVINSGTLSVNSTEDKGGNIEITGDEITIETNSTLSATGKTGGGQILVGGSWQNSDPSVYQSTITTVETDTLIDASVTLNGDGGEIVIWSDITNKNSITTASGTLYAKGGSQGGDGGRIETSGYKLKTNDISVSTNAINGKLGLWLIDPNDYIVAASGGDITGSTLASNLASSTVTILSSDGGTANAGGDIIINDSISYSSSNETTLTLTADRDIAINNSITSSDGKLNLALNASGESVLIANDITTKGGSITITSSDISFQKTGSTQNIDTSRTGATGGTINFGSANTTLASGGDGLNIVTGGGAFTSTGTIDSASSYETRKVSDQSIAAIARGNNNLNGGNTVTINTGFNNEEGKVTLNLVLWDSWDWSDVHGYDYVSINSGSETLYIKKPNSVLDEVEFTTTAPSGATWTDDKGLAVVNESETSGIFDVTLTSNSEIGGNSSWEDPKITVSFNTSENNFTLSKVFNSDSSDEDVALETSSVGSFSTSYSSKSSLSLNTGSGSITMSGNIGATKALNNLSINSTSDQIITSVISGTDTTLTKLGTGKLSLTGSNTYTGNTTVSAGTLGLYNNAAAGTGSITFADNTDLLIGRSVTEIANDFILNGSTTIDLDSNIEYLIVGGGGGGGGGQASEHGGGGGGAGVLTGSTTLTGTNTVVVGAGGNGGQVTDGNRGHPGSIGSISTFAGLTAYGGGGGSSYFEGDASVSNASGGGGAVSATLANTTGAVGGSQGNDGGNVGGTGVAWRAAAGGGGAGSNGASISSSGDQQGGSGGDGVASDITGSTNYYGAGGAGGGNTVGPGGSSVGGDGGNESGTLATAGSVNTGSGGGGGMGTGGATATAGAAGGSGIVIARYLGGDSGNGGTESNGTGTAAGYRLHTFTSTGSTTLTLNDIATTLSGDISGSGSLSIDSTDGVITFTGNNSYTGTTTISDGIVKANHANALGNLSAVTLGTNAGTRLDLLQNLTVGSIAGGSGTNSQINLDSYKLVSGGDNSSTTFGCTIY